MDRKSVFVVIVLLIMTRVVYSQELLHTLDSLIMDSKYEQVISTADDALRRTVESDKIVQLENKKAESLISLGRYDEAGKLLEQIYGLVSNNKLPDEFLARTRTNEGFLDLNKGRNDLAEEKLQSAIGLLENTGKMNTAYAARTVNILGLVYLNTGKYNQAREQIQRALDIRNEIPGVDKELIAASYNDLGLVYSQIDKNKAVEFYSMAMNIYREIHGENHPKIAIAKTNLGIIYRETGQFSQALNNFQSALDIWNSVYPGDHANKAFVMQNNGQTYEKMGAYNRALDDLNKALTMYHNVYGIKHPEVATVLNEIGNVKSSLGEYKEAIQDYQSAIVANVGDFRNYDYHVNPPAANYFNGNVLLYSLLFKAEALESWYFNQTIRLSDLKLALNTLQLCDSLIDRIRQRSINVNDKIALGVIASGVYADGVRIANEVAQNVIFKRSYRELAFFFAEKSKGAVLQEAISDTDAKSFAGIPADLLEKERELKSEISTISQKIAMMAGEKEMEALRKKAFDLNREYESFVGNLEKDYPEYFNLKYNSKAPTVGQVQELLDPSTAVLSYFTDDKNNRLYIFLIGSKYYRIFDKPFTADFDRMITGLRNSLYYDEIMSSELTGSHLYDKLIPRLPSSVKNLIIIPSGRLAIVPFETLVAKNVGDVPYKDVPFLIRQYSIRYEFSAGLLLQKARTKINASPSIFLCAPVSFPPSEKLRNLPGTRQEVSEISDLFKKNHLTASVVTESQANETMVKSDDLQHYNLIHLATHGLVNETDPQLSCVYLQPDEPKDDGILYAGEIYNLKLDANLVTLSACKTGLGKITKGEGVIGLSRALIYAGARNIIVSYWNVADRSTAQLMTDFYQYQISDPQAGFSNNLRKAKLNLLNSGIYSSPYYWAPFILIGY